MYKKKFLLPLMDNNINLDEVKESILSGLNYQRKIVFGKIIENYLCMNIIQKDVMKYIITLND